MGNSESVIVSRHERERKAGGRYHTIAQPLDRKRHHRKRPRHTANSDSDTSSRRPKHKVRFGDPESSSDAHVERPSGIRYSKDYAHGGYTGMEFVVDQGYVIPGIRPSSRDRVRAVPNQDFTRPPPPRPTTQARRDVNNRAGSHIPRRVVSIYKDESAHRPEEWSRRPYDLSPYQANWRR